MCGLTSSHQQPWTKEPTTAWPENLRQPTHLPHELAKSNSEDPVPRIPRTFSSMATENNDVPALAETLEQVKIPEGMMDMAIEDVIPKVWLAFMWRKNKARLEQARQLNLDLSTVSISDKTSLVSFHSMADEEMDLKHSGNDGRFTARDLAMWKRFLDAEKAEEKRGPTFIPRFCLKLPTKSNRGGGSRETISRI